VSRSSPSAALRARCEAALGENMFVVGGSELVKGFDESLRME
jgi:dihydrofolate reductase